MKELDKVPSNINTFTPSPTGAHDIHAYLQDIDFYLQRLDNVTTQDIICLKIISSLEVQSFLN